MIYAWENPGVPVDEVVNDVLRAFHHPAARNEHIEIQRDMFDTVRRWTQETPHRNNLNHLLSSESVRHNKNHVLSDGSPANRSLGGGCGHGDGGHGKPAGSLWSQIQTASRENAASPSSGIQPVPPSMHGQAASYYAASSPQPTPSPSQPAYGHQGYPGQGAYGQHPHPHAHSPAYGENYQGQGPGQPPHYGGGYQAPQQPSYPPQGQQPPPWGQYPRY